MGWGHRAGLSGNGDSVIRASLGNGGRVIRASLSNEDYIIF